MIESRDTFNESSLYAARALSALFPHQVNNVGRGDDSRDYYSLSRISCHVNCPHSAVTDSQSSPLTYFQPNLFIPRHL